MPKAQWPTKAQVSKAQGKTAGSESQRNLPVAGEHARKSALRCVPREREHGGHAHRLHEGKVFGESLPHQSAPVREIRGSNGFAFSFLVASWRFLRMRLEVALRRFACEVQQAYQAARSKHQRDGESDAQQSRPEAGLSGPTQFHSPIIPALAWNDNRHRPRLAVLEMAASRA